MLVDFDAPTDVWNRRERARERKSRGRRRFCLGSAFSAAACGFWYWPGSPVKQNQGCAHSLKDAVCRLFSSRLWFLLSWFYFLYWFRRDNHRYYCCYICCRERVPSFGILNVGWIWSTRLRLEAAVAECLKCTEYFCQICIVPESLLFGSSRVKRSTTSTYVCVRISLLP